MMPSIHQVAGITQKGCMDVQTLTQVAVYTLMIFTIHDSHNTWKTLKNDGSFSSHVTELLNFGKMRRNLENENISYY